MPKVSVIIPNYNHAKFLNERIDSVLSQTYRDFEVIILDDCSTDNSRDIIESYRGHEKIVHIEYNKKNSGSTFKQWEKGIKLSQGEWIWIAESDDVADPEFLANFVRVNKKYNNVGIIVSNSSVIDENSNIIIEKIRPSAACSKEIIGIEFIKQCMLFENSIPNASAVVFKKNLFSCTEIINYKLNGDWLIWIKILQETNIFFVDECLNYFRNHNTNVRLKQSKNNKNIFEYGKILLTIFKSYYIDDKLKEELLIKYFSLYIKPSRLSLKENIKLFSIGRKLQNGIKLKKFNQIIFLKKLYN